jgi:hypothetical protein
MDPRKSLSHKTILASAPVKRPIVEPGGTGRSAAGTSTSRNIPVTFEAPGHATMRKG